MPLRGYCSGVVDTGPVLVDHRERGSAIPKALVAAGLDVQLTDLPVGDYVLGLGLAVERKSPTGRGAPTIDGRIFDQAVSLRSAFPQSVLIAEGEPPAEPQCWR